MTAAEQILFACSRDEVVPSGAEYFRYLNRVFLKEGLSPEERVEAIRKKLIAEVVYVRKRQERDVLSVIDQDFSILLEKVGAMIKNEALALGERRIKVLERALHEKGLGPSVEGRALITAEMKRDPNQEDLKELETRSLSELAEEVVKLLEKQKRLAKL